MKNPAAVIRSSADGTCTVSLLEPHPIPPSTVCKLYGIPDGMALVPRELVEQAATLVGPEVFAVRTSLPLSQSLRGYLRGAE